MIIYFTGTGNSGLVAKKISEILGDETLRLEYPFVKEIDNIKEGRIVWVFPIYSWGIPPVVAQFMSEISITVNVNHYMVCTCGDDIGLASKIWRNLIRKRGWNPIGSWSVQMPNVYVLLPGFNVDSRSLEEVKLNSASERIEKISRGIKHGARVDDVVKGSFSWIKSRIINPFFVKFMMSPKPFASYDSCTGCAKCVKKCPMRNIALKDGRPVWGGRCAMCLECYHCCPVKAVHYGNRTKSKGQYQAPRVLPV